MIPLSTAVVPYDNDFVFYIETAEQEDKVSIKRWELSRCKKHKFFPSKNTNFSHRFAQHTNSISCLSVRSLSSLTHQMK